MANDTEDERDRTGGSQKPAWLEALDERLRVYAPHSASSPPDLEYVLSAKIKEYLLCEDDDAAARFARHFDNFDFSVYKPKVNRQAKGWTGYLELFYEIIVDVAVEARYDDPVQDKIIQLLLELRKLPPRTVKLWVQLELGTRFKFVDSEIWTRDPILPQKLNEPRCCENPILDPYIREYGREHAEKGFHEDIVNYVNCRVFLARCMGAGLDDGFRDRFTTAGKTISFSLRLFELTRFQAYENMDFHTIVAAQYIILAGDVLDAECVKKQLPPHLCRHWDGWANGNGSVVWKRWGDRLQCIVEALESGGELDFELVLEKNRVALKDMVIRARDKVVALEPELFAKQDRPED